MRRALVALAPLVAACPSTATTPQATSGAPGAAPLAGPCVDVRADALRRYGPDADASRLSIEAEVDLDGDGVADPFVSDPSFCGTGGCTWELYLARGGCGVHLLEVFAVFPTALKTRHHGLADLAVTIKNGCAGLARTELVLSFDGARYVPVRQRDCTCPALDDDGAGTAAPPSPDATCSAWGPAHAMETP
jgi:hypothetical protein